MIYFAKIKDFLKVGIQLRTQGFQFNAKIAKLIISITSLIILTNIGAVNFVERTCTRPMQNPLVNSKKA